ncbi:MAG: Cyclopropane-fatty-acyl-phospholipid synthase, partial [Steroidobacteraceae bacterium]|nr:Cyclopropane-fatty-acyl-phospholipid synthase [Steroidobacteraceae bacterium]
MNSARRTIEEILLLADIRINGDRPWDMRVRDDRLFERILAKGTLGL